MKKSSVLLIFVSQFAFWFNFCTSSNPTIIPVQYVNIEARPILLYDGKTLAEVILDEDGVMRHCRLHELEEESDAEPIIKNSGLPVKYPSFREMLMLINKCTQLEKPGISSTEAPPTTASSVLDINSWSQWSLWNGILPGTKWCGIGDIAGSFEELGRETEVDSCCRAHDHCPVKLKAFRTGYGLINLSLYTKSHCDCDKEFHSCLKNTRNKFADAVGNFYFNFMKMQCIKEHRPFICIENRTEIDGGQQCVKWGEDPHSTKMHVTITELEY